MGPFDAKNLTIVIDTREQRPFSFPPGVRTIRSGLVTGDYSLAGYTRTITIERKSLDDIAGCCGTHRERFGAEVLRLLGYPMRAILIEGTRIDIAAHRYKSRIHPNAVLGSLLQWENEGVPIVYAKDREEAARLCYWKLRLAAQKRWEEVRGSIHA